MQKCRFRNNFNLSMETLSKIAVQLIHCEIPKNMNVLQKFPLLKKEVDKMYYIDLCNSKQ